MTQIDVTHRHGAQFAVQVGSHELILDQSLRGGGEDAGPSPLDLLGAALGGCVAYYVHRFLCTRRLSTAGLRVEVEQHSVANPHRIGRFDVHITLPAEVPALYTPLIEAVARVCPVHNTLAASAEIAVYLEWAPSPDAVSDPVDPTSSTEALCKR
jgi:putative redox protein